MSIVNVPDFVPQRVNVKVRLPAPKARDARLLENLQRLFTNKEHCDVELICAEESIWAHKAVLGSQSAVFKWGMQADQSQGCQQIRLADVANPEAVHIMLRHLYDMDDGDWRLYNPCTEEINRDVLKLAHNFQLPGLAERAIHWMSKDLKTNNVVERLSICEEFGLHQLSNEIIGQLAGNNEALFAVSHSPWIMQRFLQYPKLMQALLQQAVGVSAEPGRPKGKGHCDH